MKDLFAALLFFSFFTLELFIGSLSLWAFQDLIHAKPLSFLQENFRKFLWLIIPLVILFFILGFGLSELFPWASTPHQIPPAGSHMDLQPNSFRNAYLNLKSFSIRTGIYFLIWLSCGFQIIRNRSLKAPLILILMGLTATFAAMDWILSLDPLYHSTAFGLIFFVSCALMAFAFHLRSLPASSDPEVRLKLNNIHLALLGSWAYVAFMEYLIVWFGNTTEESPWFIHRLHTNWKSIGLAMIVLQFAIPCFLFFFRALKKSLLFTRSLALLTIYMQAMYLLWLIFPSLYPEGWPVSVPAALALGLVAGSPFLLPRWLL